MTEDIHLTHRSWGRELNRSSRTIEVGHYCAFFVLATACDKAYLPSKGTVLEMGSAHFLTQGKGTDGNFIVLNRVHPELDACGSL